MFGEDAQKMYAAWQHDVDVILVESLDSAVSKANEFVKEGDTVLFAPACASFDMFANFEERGDRFATLVNRL